MVANMAKGNKKNRKPDILFIIAILLLLVGVAFLLIDPIKNYKRKKIVESMYNSIESQIVLEDTQITFIVDRDANKVNGEEYELYGNEEEQAQQQQRIDEEMENLPDYVTLYCVGMIDIDTVDIHLPVWDSSSIVALRYGAGHYEDSVMPGEAGNCTILAHHMRSAGSMFNRLDEVEIGDLVKITVQGGHELIYTVDQIKIIEASELLDYVNGDITDTKQLTLITCTYDDTGRKLRLLVIGHIIED